MQPPDDRRPALQPPRFRLRTLMLAVSLLCMLLAALLWLDPWGKFAAIMAVLTILAHVSGAAIGHQLRDLGSRPADGEKSLPRAERYRAVRAGEFARPTRLSVRRGPGKWVLFLTVVWAMIGAGGGAALLYVLNGERSNVVNISSGAAAFAVLGAIWGFALASFVQELFSAWWEAQRSK